MALLPQVERELRGAEERHFASRRAGGSHHRSVALADAWRRRGTGVVLGVAVIVPVVIAVLAVALLGRHHGPVTQPATPAPQNVRTFPLGLFPLGPPPAAGPSLPELLARFAVLRRPQTAADRQWRPSGNAAPSRIEPLLPHYQRLATSLSDGEQVFVTVGRFPRAADGQAAGTYELNLWLVKGGRVIGGEPYSPQVGPYSINPGSLAYTDHLETWASLIPDGVRAARWTFPATNAARTHVYPGSLTVTVPVHSNVAAVRAPRSATFIPTDVEWITTDGRILHPTGRTTTLPSRPNPPSAQNHHRHTTLRAVLPALRCEPAASCRMPLAQAHTPQATAERRYVTHLIQRGDSSLQIIATIRAVYGPTALTAIGRRKLARASARNG